jgi:ribonuclease HIII
VTYTPYMGIPPLDEIERSTCRYIIGLDECGTGAWAGPAAVGAVVARREWAPGRRVRDSKKLAYPD